jgi:hypothetical protein
MHRGDTLGGLFDGLPGGVQRWIPVVVVSVLAVPLAFAAARRLESRRRARGLPAGAARRQALAEVGIVAGTVPWLWMILTPLPARREVNPVPLVDLIDQLTGSAAVALVQVVGNLLVFAAFGALAPVRWRVEPWVVIALAAAASVTVEILQYGLDLGRVSSVDDVLLNAAGAGLAALASRRWWASRESESHRREARQVP